MMQFIQTLAPIVVAIFGGGLVTSILLGFVLRRHKDSVSESSILVRLGLLVVLAIATGITIFTWFVLSWAILLFAGPVSLCFGIVLLRD